MTEKVHRNALKQGFQLHWYRIEHVLGQGGFGITYLAHDLNLDRDVAIKEYLPIQIAVREATVFIQPVTAESSEQFRWGLDRFLSEARTLAKFEHRNIVRVLNVFEANNTAYMVMGYEEGESLHDLFNRRGTLEQAELEAILMPLLDGLEKVHARGFIHRDIKPANILIRQDGSPVLLDFGSARQSLGAQTHTLTRIFTPGYAPLEQYYTKGDQQGPWTDIYGLAATLYRGLAGVAPMDAVQRSQEIIQATKDPFLSAKQVGKHRYTPRFLAAIDRALSFKPKDRPQSISAWREQFAPVTMASRDSPRSQLDSETTLIDRSLHAVSRAWAEWPVRLTMARLTELLGSRLRSLSPPQDRRSLGTWLAGLLGVGIVLALGMLFVFRGNEPPSPGPQSPAAVAQNAEAPVAVQEAGAPGIESLRPQEAPGSPETQPAPAEPTSPPPIPEPDPELRVQEQIDRLIAGAQEDTKLGRLTAPKGNNALEKYRAVLALRAEEPQATQGIRAVADGLIKRAREALKRHDWRKAQGHLDRAAGILPDTEELAALQQELNALKTEAQSQEPGLNLTEAERKVNKLLEQARQAMEHKQWEPAQAYIDQAAAIMPHAEDVVLIQGELMAGKAQAERQPAEEVAKPQQAESEHPAAKDKPLAKLESEHPAAKDKPLTKVESEHPAAKDKPLIKIEKASSTLSKVRAGETVGFITEYSLTLPKAREDTFVEITWVLKKDGRKLGGEGVLSGMAKSGRNTASNELTLPKYTKPGKYVVEHKVDADGSSAVGTSYFSVLAN